MKRYIFLFIAIAAIHQVNAQNGPKPGEPGFLDLYTHYNFNGQFSARVTSDQNYNYFILDFSLLNTRFEKIYFMNRSFSVNEVVNLGFEADKNIVCFKTLKSYKENEIQLKFEALLKETKKYSSEWDSVSQQEWLLKNDKYK